MNDQVFTRKGIPARDIWHSLYTLETWSGDRKIHDDIKGLSLAAARHIAESHLYAFGFKVKLIAEDIDYTEVYTCDTKQGEGTWVRNLRLEIITDGHSEVYE